MRTGPATDDDRAVPDCWNGTAIDSASHVDHVAYSDDGRCPDRHPVAIPQLLLAIEYPFAGDTDVLSLTSGPLETVHADFWNAWDQDKLETEVALCINRDVVCGVAG
ncbi:MAG: DUF1996 domain-containing protein [Acidimicrobiia bacterium]|nr:DUF1996 domain-containing protein [Acidimicrobiia bacterium]